MLYLVGLGLADERDITVKGLEIVKKAERVYLEAYTAILLVDHHQLVNTSFHLVCGAHAIYNPPTKDNKLRQSRNPIMDALSSLRTGKWWRARAMIS